MTSVGREAGIRNIFISPISVSHMLGIPDKRTSDGIEKIGGDAGITKNIVDEIKKALALIIGIGVDSRIGIIRSGIAIEAPPSLTVFEDDHLTPETIGVIKDALNETPDE